MTAKSALQSPHQDGAHVSPIQGGKGKAYLTGAWTSFQRARSLSPPEKTEHVPAGSPTAAGADLELVGGGPLAGDMGAGCEWGERGRHTCARLGRRPREDLHGMSRTPRLFAGSLGRLRAKPGKEAYVRMSCFPFQIIHRTAGIFCLSEEPLGKTFTALTKGSSLPHGQKPQPPRAPETTKRRLQLTHHPHYYC